MSQLGEVHELLDEKEESISEMLGHAREAADEIASLSQALEEEQTVRANLEETVEGLQETNNIIISKLTKDRDHALACVKVLKNDKAEFENWYRGHVKLIGKFENLEKAHNALESKFSTLLKSHDQLQIQLTNKQSKSSLVQIVDVPSSSNPPCDDANLVERRNKGQRGKEGLGYVLIPNKMNMKRNNKGKAAVQRS